MSVYHRGEIEVQSRFGVREDAERLARGILREIPPAAASLLRSQRLAIAASLDGEGRPWSSLLAGPAGFIRAVDSHRLHIAAAPPAGDPLAVNLRTRSELGLLVIDLNRRLRVRFNGRGLPSPEGVFLQADEVYGNCPKYIQKRRLIAESDAPAGTARVSSSLDGQARALVAGADTFFITTWRPGGGADASHRGGRPGFVRVRDAKTLEFPDYPGNNMFNSLGNLRVHPRAGLLFVDFARGDLLQLTGRVQIRWEPETTVVVTIEEARTTPGGCPLRYELVEPSPVNPPLPVTPRAGRHLQEGGPDGPREEK
jgi:predicted pyridoxine 5'-phosphate oxidase superfamily flavin-nucleotide-binding protein